MKSFYKGLPVVLASLLSFQLVFANSFFERGLAEVVRIVQNDIIVSGLSVIFIFWGLYALFFWATRFLGKSENGGNQRVRIAISVVFSFFSGTYIILSLSDAGSRLGFVLGAWLVLILLIGGLVAGIIKFYQLFFASGDEKDMKSPLLLSGFVIGVFLLVYIFAVAFSGLSYVVLTDGQSLATSGSVTDNLNAVEQRAASQGGVSGAILGGIASLLNGIFSILAVVAFIAPFVLAVVLFKRHSSGSAGGVESSSQIREIRDLIGKMNSSLKNANTHFENKKKLLNSFLKNEAPKAEDASNSQDSPNQKEYGITHRDQYGFPHYGYK